jgi:hypothetical protein
MTSVQTDLTVLTFNSVNLTSSPAEAVNTTLTYSFTIDLFDEANEPLDDTTALLTDLFISFNGINYPLAWDSGLSKFILSGTSGNITIPNEKIGTSKTFGMFYDGNTPVNIGSIVYTGVADSASIELHLSPDDVTYTLHNDNDYYERFRTQYFYVMLKDTAGNDYTGYQNIELDDTASIQSLNRVVDGKYVATVSPSQITAITASALPDSTQTVYVLIDGTPYSRSIKWNGPMLNNSQVVLNGVTGSTGAIFNIYSGRDYPFSLLLAGASGGEPYTLNTITEDTLSMIEPSYGTYSFVSGLTLGEYKVSTTGNLLTVSGSSGTNFPFDIIYTATNYASGGTTFSFNVIVEDVPSASDTDSVIVPKEASRYFGDLNSIYSTIYDTAGNIYVPDDADRLTFYRNGATFAGSEVAPSIIFGQKLLGLLDYPEGATGGITYSAFLQTGTTGITLSSTAFVQVYDVGVSLSSQIVAGSTLIYSGEAGDCVTLTAVLYDTSGNLYDNTLTNFTMEIYNAFGTNPSIPSGLTQSSAGSTYVFFFDATNPYNDLLSFTYRLTAQAPYPTTQLGSTGTEANVIMGPRNVMSVRQSTLTADPFNVTNGSAVDMTLQLLDALRNPVDPGSNTSFLQNLQGLTFAQEFPGPFIFNQPQDAGVTGQFTFQFTVADGVTDSLTFLANYNGQYINQVETLNYSANDISMVPCFFGDAPVLTTKGYVRIDRLKQGDIVVTPDERQIPIKRVVVTKVAASRNTNPYVIPKGMFNATEKLLISPNHKVSVKGKMLESKFLNLRQDYHKGILTYYNIELERYSNMVVAGVNVESLICAKEVYVTPEQFMASLKKRYGNITKELYESTLSKFKVMPDGRIRCFATAK